MERNLSGVIIRISIDSVLDNRTESFHLFIRAEDKMCDEGRVVRIVVQIRRAMERSAYNTDVVEKMRTVADVRGENRHGNLKMRVIKFDER